MRHVFCNLRAYLFGFFSVALLSAVAPSAMAEGRDCRYADNECAEGFMCRMNYLGGWECLPPPSAEEQPTAGARRNASFLNPLGAPVSASQGRLSSLFVCGYHAPQALPRAAATLRLPPRRRRQPPLDNQALSAYSTQPTNSYESQRRGRGWTIFSWQ